MQEAPQSTKEPFSEDGVPGVTHTTTPTSWADLVKGKKADDVHTTIPLSWADLDEQYSMYFGGSTPDLEAQLMGVPPPPDEWTQPKKPVRRRVEVREPEGHECANPFQELTAPLDKFLQYDPVTRRRYLSPEDAERLNLALDSF